MKNTEKLYMKLGQLSNENNAPDKYTKEMLKTKFEDTFDLLLEYKDKKVSDFLIKKEREGDKSYEYCYNLTLLYEQNDLFFIESNQLLYILRFKLLFLLKDKMLSYIKVLDDRFPNEKNKIGNYEIDYKRYPFEEEDVKKAIDFLGINRICRWFGFVKRDKTKIVIEIKKIKDKVKETENFQFN